METSLFKVSKICWAVTSDKTKEAQTFPTIEAAAAYLESIGIKDDQIDAALIDMAANNTTRAIYDPDRGTFLCSDEVKFHELFGSA